MRLQSCELSPLPTQRRALVWPSEFRSLCSAWRVPSQPIRFDPASGTRPSALAARRSGSQPAQRRVGLANLADLDRAAFRKYAADIAWETEVWTADAPTHMIHFNGDRFLGPHE